MRDHHNAIAWFGFALSIIGIFPLQTEGAIIVQQLPFPHISTSRMDTDMDGEFADSPGSSFIGDYFVGTATQFGNRQPLEVRSTFEYDLGDLNVPVTDILSARLELDARGSFGITNSVLNVDLFGYSGLGVRNLPSNFTSGELLDSIPAGTELGDYDRVVDVTTFLQGVTTDFAGFNLRGRPLDLRPNRSTVNVEFSPLLIVEYEEVVPEPSSLLMLAGMFMATVWWRQQS